MLHDLAKYDGCVRSDGQQRTEKDGYTEKGCQKPAVQQDDTACLTERSLLTSDSSIRNFRQRVTSQDTLNQIKSNQI